MRTFALTGRSPFCPVDPVAGGRRDRRPYRGAGARSRHLKTRIGAIPEVALRRGFDKHDLGVHTEMVADASSIWSRPTSPRAERHDAFDVPVQSRPLANVPVTTNPPLIRARKAFSETRLVNA